MKILRTSLYAPNFDQAPTYDEVAIDLTYDEEADPNYDEVAQPDYGPDFTEPDYEYAGQEYRPSSRHKKRTASTVLAVLLLLVPRAGWLRQRQFSPPACSE